MIVFFPCLISLGICLLISFSICQYICLFRGMCVRLKDSKGDLNGNDKLDFSNLSLVHASYDIYCGILTGIFVRNC